MHSHGNEDLKSSSCLIQVPAENKKRTKTACNDELSDSDWSEGADSFSDSSSAVKMLSLL